jgi:hypothetical protein
MSKERYPAELFKALSLENQATLLACARVSRTAENAVKKAFADRRAPETVSGGEPERGGSAGERRR